MSNSKAIPYPSFVYPLVNEHKRVHQFKVNAMDGVKFSRDIPKNLSLVCKITGMSTGMGRDASSASKAKYFGGKPNHTDLINSGGLDTSLIAPQTRRVVCFTADAGQARVDVAREAGVYDVNHQCTGEGNSQVFLDLANFSRLDSHDYITVHAALTKPPSPQYVKYNHITAFPRTFGVSAEGGGVAVEGSASFPDEAIATPVAETKAAAEGDDDRDVHLIGEKYEEDKKAAEKHAAAVKVSGNKKESGKSSILLDVKPWDDDKQKLEEAVRSVQMEGLAWGASRIIPGYGMEKLQIMI